MEEDEERDYREKKKVHVIIIQVKWFGQVIHDMKIGTSVGG